MNESTQLLQRYVTERSEEAFSTLVSRYVNLVFSVACRQANNDSHLAQDITQTVFADLATKASSISPETQLGGWLHRRTCHVASTIRRSEKRRQKRENTVMAIDSTDSADESSWNALAPDLDLAINRLSDSDRTAIVMRFFEERNHRDIGKALQTTEDTAQKRVMRAIEKLRSILSQQGVTLSVPLLTALLEERCLATAPAELGSEISSQTVHRSSATTDSSVAGRSTTSRLLVGAGALALLITTGIVLKTEKPASDSESLQIDLNEIAVEGSIDSSKVTTQIHATESTGDVLSSQSNDQLKLIIQSKETGERLAGVRIAHRAQLQDSWDKLELTANRAGEISIPFEKDELKMLQLITKIDGYADTRLEWHPGRGDQVPSEFTVNLEPATRIGGTVVDIDGRPIVSAKVGFNHESAPEMRTRPQSFEFSWIEVKTDEEGRWEINRIANQILPLIYGSARHPEFTNSPLTFASRDHQILTSLKAGTHEFKLSAAFGISGLVTDSDQNPIADAELAFGNFGSGGRRTTTSDLEGRFTLKGCKPGMGLLTAQSESFAPSTIKVEITEATEDAHIILSKGKTLILKVVDQNNVPVTGANVWYDTFENIHSSDPTIPPAIQVEFSEKTDENGHVTWLDAPDRELTFDVHAKGFMRASDLAFHPDGTEHQVILPSALVVTGTITDEDSGEPIPSARMVTGWPNPHSTSNTREVNWSTLDRFWVDFSGGTFYHSYEEAVINGMPNPGYVLKFEADGYAPTVTRTIAANEGVVEIDIQLNRAESHDITVLLPNGSPAQQADVGLITPQSRITIVPGGLSHNRQNSDHLLTDSSGHFALKPEPEITSIIVAHPKGFALTASDEVKQTQEIHLEPWGRLEGSYQFDQDTDSATVLEVSFGESSSGNIRFDFDDFVAELDDSGEFTFEALPPGTHRLSQRHYTDSPTGRSWSTRTLDRFEIEPNETTLLHLKTHEIRISVGLPADLNGHLVRGFIHEPKAEMPISIVNDNDARRAWMRRPEIRAQLLKAKTFSLSNHKDGTWLSRKVTPGTYEASFSVYNMIDSSPQVLARTKIEFHVTDGDEPKKLSILDSSWERISQ